MPAPCDPPCGEDEHCDDGVCRPNGGPNPTPPACEPECSDDEECVDGECRGGNDPCDCATNEWCDRGGDEPLCRPGDGSCSDCDPLEGFCWRGRCIPYCWTNEEGLVPERCDDNTGENICVCDADDPHGRRQCRPGEVDRLGHLFCPPQCDCLDPAFCSGLEWDACREDVCICSPGHPGLQLCIRDDLDACPCDCNPGSPFHAFCDSPEEQAECEPDPVCDCRQPDPEICRPQDCPCDCEEQDEDIFALFCFRDPECGQTSAQVIAIRSHMRFSGCEEPGCDGPFTGWRYEDFDLTCAGHVRYMALQGRGASDGNVPMPAPDLAQDDILLSQLTSSAEEMVWTCGDQFGGEPSQLVLKIGHDRAVNSIGYFLRGRGGERLALHAHPAAGRQHLAEIVVEARPRH